VRLTVTKIYYVFANVRWTRIVISYDIADVRLTRTKYIYSIADVRRTYTTFRRGCIFLAMNIMLTRTVNYIFWYFTACLFELLRCRQGVAESSSSRRQSSLFCCALCCSCQTAGSRGVIVQRNGRGVESLSSHRQGNVESSSSLFR
jgi:hypothetical protein